MKQSRLRPFLRFLLNSLAALGAILLAVRTLSPEGSAIWNSTLIKALAISLIPSAALYNAVDALFRMRAERSAVIRLKSQEVLRWLFIQTLSYVEIESLEDIALFIVKAQRRDSRFYATTLSSFSLEIGVSEPTETYALEHCAQGRRQVFTDAASLYDEVKALSANRPLNLSFWERKSFRTPFGREGAHWSRQYKKLRREYWTRISQHNQDLFQYCQLAYIEDSKLPEYSYWIQAVRQEGRPPLAYIAIEVPREVQIRQPGHLFDILHQASQDIAKTMKPED